MAQHWNVPGGGPEVFAAKHEVLREHCAAIGRDPAEITTSTHLRLDPSGDGGGLPALVAEAEAFAAAGLDLGIVYLPPPHTPAVLEPLADALEPLASS